MKKGLLAVAAAVGALIYVGRLGLRARPSPFPPFGGRRQREEVRPPPPGLPPPVGRFYRRLYGGHEPVLRSAVITGMARMCLGGSLECEADGVCAARSDHLSGNT